MGDLKLGFWRIKQGTGEETEELALLPLTRE